MGDYSENLLYKNENLTLPFILLKENTMKKIARILIVIIVVILYFIYLFIMENLIMMKKHMKF